MTGDELSAWRGRLGLRKPAAARALGVGVRSLVRYEQGEAPIPLTVALAAAAVEKGLKPAGAGARK